VTVIYFLNCIKLNLRQSLISIMKKEFPGIILDDMKTEPECRVKM
jgi:hypothetical protein